MSRFATVAAMAASLFLTALTLAESSNSSLPENTTIATINGEPVSAAEYSLVMMRQAPRVYSLLKRERNLDDHLGYWNPDTGSEGPFAKLREMTLEELTKIKVQQAMAKEKGITKDVSFATFREEFQKENQRRKEALANGTVIYGPKQHDETSYYFILFGDLSHRLKQKVCKETAPAISEEEIRKFYDEHKSKAAALKDTPFDTVRDRIAEEIAERNFDKQLPSLFQSAQVETKEDLIRTLLPRHDVKPADTVKPETN